MLLRFLINVLVIFFLDQFACSHTGEEMGGEILWLVFFISLKNKQSYVPSLLVFFLQNIPWACLSRVQNLCPEINAFTFYVVILLAPSMYTLHPCFSPSLSRNACSCLSRSLFMCKKYRIGFMAKTLPSNL